MSHLINIGPGGNLNLDRAFPADGDPLTETARALAVQIGRRCPPNSDRTLALHRLREALAWAQASIREDTHPDPFDHPGPQPDVIPGGAPTT